MTRSALSLLLWRRINTHLNGNDILSSCFWELEFYYFYSLESLCGLS